MDKAKNLPWDWPEERALIRRLLRLIGTLDRLFDHLEHDRPVLANDIYHVWRAISCHVVAINSNLYRPQWQEKEIVDPPRPSLCRLLHQLLIARKAATAAIYAHQEASLETDGVRDCDCHFCVEAIAVRWLLGKTRRLLSAALSTSKRKELHHDRTS